MKRDKLIDLLSDLKKIVYELESVIYFDDEEYVENELPQILDYDEIFVENDD